MTARKDTLADRLAAKENKNEETKSVTNERQDELAKVPDSKGQNTVSGMAIDKTPADLAAETNQEQAERYGIDGEISDQDNDNPAVDRNRDNVQPEIISGTHLHPDLARDYKYQDVGTENGTYTRQVVETAYAEPAEIDDKGFEGRNINDPDVDTDEVLAKSNSADRDANGESEDDNK